MTSSRCVQNLRFGQTFTDHLLTVEHAVGQGWGRPQIRALADGLHVHPAAPVLHYGMCCFEGMKAYLGVDGRGRLFRSAAHLDVKHIVTRSVITRVQRTASPGEDKSPCLASASHLLHSMKKHLTSKDSLQDFQYALQA